MDVLSERERSAGFGLVRTVYLVLGLLGSFAVDFFVDGFGWAVSFGALIVLLTTIAAAVVVNRIFDLGY